MRNRSIAFGSKAKALDIDFTHGTLTLPFLFLASVGKSTVLNALLGDKFSEVALKRTTAGVNFFRIIQPKEHDGTDPEDGWSTIGDDRKLQEADVVHDEIAKDNAELRSSEKVEEKTFDIRVRYPICEMRTDTQLVLVDIPGINEADSSKKYKDYVESKWKTFDCVVIVMDAIQGVNTQEQVDLLKFVHHNNNELKDVPTIVLVNKMDDLYDEGTIHQIEETRLKTVEIFGDVDYRSALHIVEETATSLSGDVAEGLITTAFVPLSAKNAFTYMKAGCIDYDTLGEKKYSDLVNKIGHDECGRKWNRMKKREKIKIVSEILQDRSELDERLAGTNFNSFISSLSDFVGGDARQQKIISKQIEVELKGLGTESEEAFSESISEAFKRCKTIGRTDVKRLQKAFWEAYQDLENTAFDDLEVRVDPATMERPFLELQNYYELTLVLQWTEQSMLTMERMKKLVRRQLCLLKKKIEAWSFKSYCLAAGGVPYGTRIWIVPRNITWETLSPEDWMLILNSLSLAWNESCFNENFGPEKLALNGSLMTFREMFGSVSEISGAYRSTQQHQHRDEFTEFDSCMSRYMQEMQNKNKNLEARIKMPDSMVDPSHWGFLAWKYMNFCGRDKRKASSLS